jgi:hypothetical protein
MNDKKLLAILLVLAFDLDKEFDKKSKNNIEEDEDNEDSEENYLEDC